jgi:hypothetical protein
MSKFEKFLFVLSIIGVGLLVSVVVNDHFVEQRRIEKREAGCLAATGTIERVAAIAMGADEIVVDAYAEDGTRQQGRLRASWQYRHVGDVPIGMPMRLELKTAWRGGHCEGIAIIHEPTPVERE